MRTSVTLLTAIAVMMTGPAANATQAKTTPECEGDGKCPEGAKDTAGESPKTVVRFGGLHLLGGLGAGTAGGLGFRASIEAGAVVAFGPAPQTTRDGWSYRPTEGLIAGLAWSQGLERLRGEAYGEFGWATSSGYGGLLLVGGPAARLFRDLGGGVSGRACAWGMAIELCLRATGTFLGEPDASALVLLGLGIN